MQVTTYDHYKQVIPVNYLNLVHHFTTPGIPDDMLVTLGWFAGAPTISAGDLQAIAEAFADNIMGTISDEVVFEKIVASDAGGSIAEYSINATGTDTATPASVNCALLVEKLTASSGRRNRGRMYVPCIGEAWVDAAGNIDSGQVSDLQLLFDSYLTDLLAVDALAQFPVILHSKGWNGGTEPADPGNAPSPTPMTGFRVGSKIGTQRRRIR